MQSPYLVSLAVLIAAAGFAGYSVVRVAQRLSRCDCCGGEMPSGQDCSCAACGVDACNRCLAEIPDRAHLSKLRMSRLPLCPACRSAVITLAEAAQSSSAPPPPATAATEPAPA